MTKHQEHTFSMYKNVNDCLTANSSITATLPQYAAYYALFNASLSKIAILQAQQLQNTTKVQTINKATLRNNCINSVERLLVTLDAFALITKNTALKQKIKAPLTDYRDASSSVFVALCNNLYDTGFLYRTQLNSYGIKVAFFTDFRKNINNFTKIITAPRQKNIANAATTTALATLFTTIRKEFVELSTIVALTKFTKPLFYDNFLASAQLIRNAIKPLAFRAAITDPNGAPLRAFTFTFTRLSDNKKIEYSTNDNGTIIRKILKADAYNLTISKAGYTALTLSVVLQENTTYKLNAIANTYDKTISVLI